MIFHKKTTVHHFLWTYFTKVWSWIPLMCFPLFAQTWIKLVSLKMSGWIQWKLGPVVRNVQLFAFSRALNPPVAFESPIPCRNVYRSVLKTTPLTLKTAVIGSSLCQKAREKAQTHHFSFSMHSANMSSSWKSIKTVQKCFVSVSVWRNEEQIHQLIDWLSHCVWLQNSSHDQTLFLLCG